MKVFRKRNLEVSPGIVSLGSGSVSQTAMCLGAVFRTRLEHGGSSHVDNQRHRTMFQCVSREETRLAVSKHSAARSRMTGATTGRMLSHE